MSNLLQTEEGRAALFEARNYLLRRRLSRFFQRNLVIDYDRFISGSQEFDLATLLGQLNSAHDDEILELFRLLGTFGGLESSMADTSIYVDATNGNDQTGTGSADRPLASLWFVPYLPRNINHIYRIIFNTDLDMSDTILNFNQCVGPNGCLTLAGYGPEEHVEIGTEGTVTANASFVNASEFSVINPPPPAGARNAFVQATSGANQGKATPVFQVNASGNNEIVNQFSALDLAINDEIRYIRPLRNLYLKGLVLNLNMAGTIPSQADNNGSRFGLLNMRIHIDETDVPYLPISINSQGNLFISFVQFVAMVDDTNYMIQIESGWINESDLLDDAIASELGLTSLTNLLQDVDDPSTMAGFQITNVQTPTSDIILIRGHVSLFSCTFLGQLGIRESNAVVRFNSIASIDCFRSSADMDYLNMYYPASNTLYFRGSQANIYRVSFVASTSSLWLQNSRAITQEIGCDAVYGVPPNYVGYMNYQSRLTMYDNWQGAAPVVNGFFCTDPNPDVALGLPAAAGFVTDGMTNFVTRMT